MRKWEIVKCETQKNIWVLVYEDQDGYRHAHSIPQGSLEYWLLVNVHSNDPHLALNDMLMWMLEHNRMFDDIRTPAAHEKNHVAHRMAASVDMRMVRRMRESRDRRPEAVGMPRWSIVDRFQTG